MTRFPPVVLLLLAATPIATPAAADAFCDDLWFSRNQLFDRAGYCFSSVLGQAVFDNADCTGTDVTLEPGGDEMVAQIKALEADLSCKVDTSAAGGLEVANMDLRLRLETMVAPSEFASGCIGWTGAPLSLMAGTRSGAPVLSVALPGDDLVWEYDAPVWLEDWSFLSVYRESEQIGLGWYPGEIDESLCTGLAG